MTLPATETVGLALAAGNGEPAASVTVRRTYSLALAVAGIPFLVAANRICTSDDSLTLALDGCELRWIWPADGSRAQEPAEAAWHGFLEGLTGARPFGVHLGRTDQASRAEVFLTDPWWWNWGAADLGALPALVLPQDGVVRQIALAARRLAGDSASAAVSTEALFGLMRDEYEIGWQPPRLEHLPSGPSLQPIRPPHRAVFDLHQRRGEATCIDLVLLLAGCLEAMGQAPVVIVVPDEQERPSHALLGWWTDAAQRYRPLLTSTTLLTAWRRGEFAALETTRLCCDRTATLAEAASEALAVIQGGPGAVGVDVRATRPPTGRVRPVDPLNDPAVMAALAAAEVVAHMEGSTVIETVHLLHGLVSEAGNLGLRLMAASRINARELAADCREEIARRRRQDRVGRTRGMIRCLDDARHNARSQGGTVVRESDLWWAVLSLPGASLQELFARRPDVRSALLTALAEIAPLPRHGSSLQ